MLFFDNDNNDNKSCIRSSSIHKYNIIDWDIKVYNK